MLDVFGKKIIVKILGGLVIFQICQGIIIPIKEQPRPAYTSGIKTARRPDSPYTLQNYSRVIVHNRPDIDGAQYVITKTDQVKSVYPVFNPNTNRENYQNILQTQSHTKIDAGEASRTNRTIIKRKIEAKTLDIYTKCPSGATGQFIYSASCNQFLNCWKGRGTVQNCAPGTLFNPKSLECDFPDKVECVTGPRSNTVENIRVQKSIQQATCPEGFSGIIPDYFDCSKFINCNNGQENKMDCAPGTLFDINKNMCDYPHQTTCFNGENTLNAKTTLLNCNSATHCDLSSNYEQSEHDQTGSVFNQRPVYNQGQYQYSTSKNGQSGTNLNGGNSYSQSNTVTQGCNPSTQNCEQFSGQRPIYNQGQNQYSTSNNGYSGTDLSGGNSYSQSHNVVAQRCNPATQNCGKISGQRPIYNHGQNQYQTTADGQSGTDLSGDNSYSQSHTVTQRCNPATQNCGQISGQRPIYNHGQNQYQTTADGQSGTDLSGGNYYNQSHIVTQGCNPATQNCGQISGQRPIYNQGQNQYQTTDNGQSGTDLSGDNSYSQFHNIVTQRCNPATQNCGQISGQRPIYNHGQNQYQTTADGQSGTDLSGGNYYSQSHTVTQGCNPATQNCGQISGQRPIYNQGQNQYQTTANGQSGTDLSGDNSYSQTHNIVTQRCNPATQNCGQISGQKPIYNQGQNQYTTPTDGQSGTDLSGSNSYSQSHIVTQGCNPVTQNCGQISGQRPIYNQGQNQYETTANEHSGTDLSGDNSYSQSHTVTQECNPATQNCEQFSRQKPTYYQGQKLHTNNGQSQTNYHTDTSQYGQTGQNGVFNCDLSKPNCGHTQQPNYGKVCNVNDPNCGKNQWATQKPVTNRPAVNSQPICPNDSVGLHKHPTDCKKYLSCGSGQTFVMDCAAGTLFNEKTGMCDFPSNVQCVVSEVVEDKDTGGGNYDESWQIQYENNKQKFGQNAGQGNIRYTTEITEVNNQLPSENKGQQTIGDNSRGSTGYVKRPNVKNTPLDYEDVYNPDNNILTGTTPRSAWPPPYQTEDTNELGETDYVFTYDNGDPVVLEPDNVIEVKERVAIKSCDGESFHCSPKYCVPLTTLCDGVRDCSDGKDELNCQEYTDRFITTKNSKLVVPENQRYINITHSTCAVLCIQNRKFTCRSFTYRRPDRTCFLSDKNIGMSGALQAYQSSDYYELKAGSIDCSDTSKYFECNNKKCLTKDHLCDGYTDCEDREDEKHCGPEKFGYKVKLVGSNDKNSGRVEVTAFNSTGYICDDDFSIVDANVICRELGFALGAAEIKGQSQFAKDLKESNTLYMIDDLNCIGNESSLIDCSFPGWGIHNCRDQEIAGIVCKTPQEKCGDDAWKCDSGNECIPFDFVCDGVDDCADESDEAVQHCESPTDLRLVDGSYPGEGRLEIKHNGIWGTVCDDDFNEDAAKVVCKFLGYKGHSYVKKDGYFGAGYGPIWLDQVSCFGNETELNKCTHWNWGEHNCEHSEDVGIICSQDVGEVKIERHSNLQSRIEEGLPRNCGFRKDNQFAINDLIQARVIGGGVAQKGDYPWQAALKVRVKEKSAHWCGAIIISSKWVLTAAHCLQGYTKGAYIIVAGEYDTNENEGTEQQKYIDEFFIHEKFRKGHKLNNDIALIKVKSSGFELNDDVQPICLADADTDYNRKLNCTISGFGSVKSGSSSVSRNLLAAWIPIHSQDICKMEHVYGNILTDGMFCAGSMDGGLDACDGDSGGPLACLDQGVFTLYGITSWGQHCGYANKPGVYVKVGHYKKWIEDIIAKHSN